MSHCKMTKTKVSKSLTYILRHQAVSWGMNIGPDGFIVLSEILDLDSFQGVDLATVQSIVQNCEKQRFELVYFGKQENQLTNPHFYKIRAVQGHSMTVIQDSQLLEEITDETMASLPQSVVFHGTYRKCLSSIMKNGLSRMRRNHIHFAIDVPQSGNVISGMRGSAEVAIVIDLSKARAAGIQFFLSKNKVVLSKGVAETGAIPAEFFQEVIYL